MSQPFFVLQYEKDEIWRLNSRQLEISKLYIITDIYMSPFDESWPHPKNLLSFCHIHSYRFSIGPSEGGHGLQIFCTVQMT